MKKNQLFSNSLLSAVQVIWSGISLFLLYRFLLQSLSFADLGLWSIVLSTCSVTAISSFGLSGSVVKFVAQYYAISDFNKIKIIIETAAISITIFMGAILVLAYPLITIILSHALPTSNIDAGLSLLPYALITLWIASIAGIFQGGIDGCHRMDLRNILLIINNILYLVSAYILTPMYGIQGLAIAQIMQAIMLCILSWFLLKRQVTNLSFIPYHWDKLIFKEIALYGLNFQIISILQMLYEPVTKVLLGKFGGLDATGYYDIAYRMMMQFRSIFISANQASVPLIASKYDNDVKNIKKIYNNNLRLMAYFSFPFFVTITILFPIISILWLGSYQKFFVMYALLISASCFIGTITVPAYFANLGTGLLKWNIIAHIVIGILNASLAILLGLKYNGIGVILASIISSSCGSLIILLAFHIINKMPLLYILKENASYIILWISSLTLNYIIYDRNYQNIYFFAAISLSFTVLCIIPTMIFHPMKHKLKKLIFAK